MRSTRKFRFWAWAWIIGVVLAAAPASARDWWSEGPPQFLSSVATSALLPAKDNTKGDVRMTLNDFTLHYWDGSAWQLWANVATNYAGSASPGGPATSVVPRTRTLTVDAGATADGTTIFNTIKAAMDYAGAQTHDATHAWDILIYGEGPYAEAAFTVPSYVNASCVGGGGNIYPFGGACRVTTALTAGTFITMQGGSLRNMSIAETAAATAARTLINCTGGTAGYGAECYLDHVGLLDWLPGSQVDILVNVAGTFWGYYVDFGYVGGGANTVALKAALSGANAVTLDNFVVEDGGASQGIGIWSTTTSNGGVRLRNGRVGSVYSTGKYATDLENDAGSMFASAVDYRTSSGTITDQTGTHPPVVASDLTCPGGGFWINSTNSTLCWCQGSTKKCSVAGT